MKFKIGDKVKIPTTKHGDPLFTSAAIGRALEENKDYLIITGLPGGESLLGGLGTHYVLWHELVGTDGDYFDESDLEYYEPVVTLYQDTKYKLISDVYYADLKNNTKITTPERIVIGLFENIKKNEIIYIRCGVYLNILSDISHSVTSIYKDNYVLDKIVNETDYKKFLQLINES